MTKLSTRGTMEVAPWALIATTKTSKNQGKFWSERNACSNGHEYVDGSFYYRPDLKRGTPVRICRVCRAESSRKSNLKTKSADSDTHARILEHRARQAHERYAAKKLGMTVQEYRRIHEGEQIAKKHPLHYLATSEREGVAQDRLNYQVDRLKVRPKCESDPDAYFVDGEMSNEWAEKLCAGCPLMVECFDRMKTAAPEVGSMAAGGRYFFDGKLVSK